MRAVIYARYSSYLQREASIEDQVRLCRDRISNEGWRYLHAYTDRARSASHSLRAAYQELLQDARRRKFEVIVAESLDRLSRDQEDIAGLYKRLSFMGIRIVTLAEGEINELHVGLKGTMNALFLKDLAAKTWRGLEGRVRQGRSGGGLCYGYDVVRESDAAGNAIRGGRRINEDQAEVVRRVFAAFAGGASPRAIARTLNAESVPGPYGRPWIDTTIRGHGRRGTGILRNELYIGRLVWNRLRYVKDPATGKRISRLNPVSSWVTEELPALRIVDQDLWEKVQARLGLIRDTPAVAKLRQSRFWEKRRPRHLLSGLVHCGVCGKAMAAIGKDYLACNHARRNSTCTNKAGMRRDRLEALILDGLKRELMHPDLVKAFIAEFHREVNRLRGDESRRQAEAARELAQVTRKLESLVDAIADGLRAPGLQRKLDELETRRTELEQTTAAPAPAPRLHPNLAELYRQKVEALHEALNEPATRPEALEILRSLIERIAIHPAENGIEIELVGAIAQMVAFANGDSKKAALGRAACRDAYGSVKVVAGAGFEPTTFRL